MRVMDLPAKTVVSGVVISKVVKKNCPSGLIGLLVVAGYNISNRTDCGFAGKLLQKAV